MLAVGELECGMWDVRDLAVSDALQHLKQCTDRGENRARPLLGEGHYSPPFDLSPFVFYFFISSITTCFIVSKQPNTKYYLLI
jgi:hypothetical protein